MFRFLDWILYRRKTAYTADIGPDGKPVVTGKTVSVTRRFQPRSGFDIFLRVILAASILLAAVSIAMCMALTA